jgi:hypothetical protein
MSLSIILGGGSEQWDGHAEELESTARQAEHHGGGPLDRLTVI